MSGKRCSSKNQDGMPCGALAWRDGLCRWHHPDSAPALAESRRKGGEATSKAARARKAVAQAAPRDMAEIDVLIREAMAGVLSGAVQPRQALALAALARASAAIREQVDVDRRLAALEKWLHEREREQA